VKQSGHERKRGTEAGFRAAAPVELGRADRLVSGSAGARSAVNAVRGPRENPDARAVAACAKRPRRLRPPDL